MLLGDGIGDYLIFCLVYFPFLILEFFIVILYVLACVCDVFDDFSRVSFFCVIDVVVYSCFVLGIESVPCLR